MASVVCRSHRSDAQAQVSCVNFLSAVIIHTMSKGEIIAGLQLLSPDELAEVQARLDELAGDAWQDRGELSDNDKVALDAALAAYEKSPDDGSSWEETKARVIAKLRL